MTDLFLNKNDDIISQGTGLGSITWDNMIYRIKIYVYSPNSIPASGVLVTVVGQIHQETVSGTTDLNGEIEFDLLPYSGMYTILLEHEILGEATHNQRLVWGNDVGKYLEFHVSFIQEVSLNNSIELQSTNLSGLSWEHIPILVSGSIRGISNGDGWRNTGVLSGSVDGISGLSSYVYMMRVILLTKEENTALRQFNLLVDNDLFYEDDLSTGEFFGVTYSEDLGGLTLLGGSTSKYKVLYNPRYGTLQNYDSANIGVLEDFCEVEVIQNNALASFDYNGYDLLVLGPPGDNYEPHPNRSILSGLPVNIVSMCRQTSREDFLMASESGPHSDHSLRKRNDSRGIFDSYSSVVQVYISSSTQQGIWNFTSGTELIYEYSNQANYAGIALRVNGGHYRVHWSAHRGELLTQDGKDVYKTLVSYLATGEGEVLNGSSDVYGYRVSQSIDVSELSQGSVIQFDYTGILDLHRTVEVYYAVSSVVKDIEELQFYKVDGGIVISEGSNYLWIKQVLRRRFSIEAHSGMSSLTLWPRYITLSEIGSPRLHSLNVVGNGGQFSVLEESSYEDFIEGEIVDLEVSEKGHLELLASSQPSSMNYNFTFTSCQATGRFGPDQSQVDTEYQGTDLEGMVTSVGGIQEFVVPTSGRYKIVASGAGFGHFSSQKGARMSGYFDLEEGQKIKILVGQKSSNLWSGSGGTFVVLDDNTPLIIAGGSGGGSSQNVCLEGTVNTTGQTSSENRSGGSNGSGGMVSANCWANSGAGLLGNGDGCDGAVPLSFINGGTGGLGDTSARVGGFGGGGTGRQSDRLGGGGGYSGGGAANNGAGGGGGSYNIGEDQDNESGVHDGDGLVEISITVEGVGDEEGSDYGSRISPRVDLGGFEGINSLTVDWTSSGLEHLYSFVDIFAAVVKENHIKNEFLGFGNGETLEFTLRYPPSGNVIIRVGNTVVTDFTIEGRTVIFTKSPIELVDFELRTFEHQTSGFVDMDMDSLEYGNLSNVFAEYYTKVPVTSDWRHLGRGQTLNLSSYGSLEGYQLWVKQELKTSFVTISAVSDLFEEEAAILVSGIARVLSDLGSNMFVGYSTDVFPVVKDIQMGRPLTEIDPSRNHVFSVGISSLGYDTIVPGFEVIRNISLVVETRSQGSIRGLEGSVDYSRNLEIEVDVETLSSDFLDSIPEITRNLEVVVQNKQLEKNMIIPSVSHSRNISMKVTNVREYGFEGSEVEIDAVKYLLSINFVRPLHVDFSTKKDLRRKIDMYLSKVLMSSTSPRPDLTKNSRYVYLSSREHFVDIDSRD